MRRGARGSKDLMEIREYIGGMGHAALVPATDESPTEDPLAMDTPSEAFEVMIRRLDLEFGSL